MGAQLKKSFLLWSFFFLLIFLLNPLFTLLNSHSRPWVHAEPIHPSPPSPISPLLTPTSPENLRNPLVNALRQSTEMTASGFCKELPSSIKPPEEIQSILQLPLLPDPFKPDLMRSRITALLRPLTEGTQGIDQTSKIYQEALKRSLSFSQLEKPTWFAGGSHKNYRIPQDQSLDSFFRSLFLLIPEQSLSWNPTQLSRADLFHAHLVVHRELKDLLLIFHAKEYPRDHPSLCSGCLMQKLFQTFALELPRTIQSIPPTESYLRRNFLISLTRRRLCGVNTQTPLFLKLAQDDGDGSTLDPLKVTDLDQEGLILDLHFFANEGTPLFIDLLRTP